MSTSILLLELRGYKRMALNNIHHFVFRPKEKTQVILGTNGSGKSSLLSELNPLPAHPSNYSKDGYKIIEIQKNRDHYRLESRFDPRAQHFFYKNGENLNQGGTITVQRDLVLREFGITQAIADLISGFTRFTRMPSGTRREWFTLLDESNYDYALAIYARLKERHRDTVGALKIAKKRLVLETSKAITDAEQDKLREEIATIHSEITILLENKVTPPSVIEAGSLDRAIDFIERRYFDSEALLAEASQMLLKLKVKVPEGFSFESEQDIEQCLFDLHGKISFEEGRIKAYSEDHENHENLRRKMIENSGQNATSVQDSAAPILKEIEDLSNSKQLNLTIESPVETLRALESVEDILLSVFMEIEEDPNNLCTISRLNELKETRARYQGDLQKLNSELEYIRSDKRHLEHLRDGVKTNCPRCNHIWTPGYDREAYEACLVRLEAKTQQITELETHGLKTIEKEIERVMGYLFLERDYNHCKGRWVLLRPLWELLGERNTLKTNPKSISSIINRFKNDLLIDIKIEKLKEKLIEIDVICKALLDKEISNIAELEKRIEELAESISRFTGFLTKLLLDQSEITRYRNTMKQMVTYKEKIKAAYSQFSSDCEERVRLARLEFINQAIKELQLSLANKENALSTIVSQKELVKDLEKQIESLSDDEAALARLIKEISPTDGVIAEGLFGFIKVFVRQMNRLISRVWTYPLEIVPCGISEDNSLELDYKFPLIVKTKDNEVPDIDKGSSAMQEMVDVAFVIVAMKYLGLSDYWLILDEFAKAMDHEHKRASVDLIKTIMEEKTFSQLYMVSHDFLQYDGIANKEVCVLSESNILLPEIYNQHVTFN